MEKSLAVIMPMVSSILFFWLCLSLPDWNKMWKLRRRVCRSVFMYFVLVGAIWCVLKFG